LWAIAAEKSAVELDEIKGYVNTLRPNKAPSPEKE